jgi:hypothetical protein
MQMRRLLISSAAVIALFSVPAFAQNACEKPDPKDTVTKSDAGEFREKPLGVADFTNAKGQCIRLTFFAGSPRGFIFASDVAQTVAISVDHSKNTLILLREDGKDVPPK